MGSETGVVDLEEERVIEKGRLGPGQMLAVDFHKNEILRNWEVKSEACLLYTSPSPRDRQKSRMPSSA